jgi:hypothetical protein
MHPSRSEMLLTPHTTGGECGRWSWELLLWALSAALVAAGALLLWRAWELGSFDTDAVAMMLTADPETGEIASCEQNGAPCHWALATGSIEYALALPALGSGLVGLLLGVALRARRGLSLAQSPASVPRGDDDADAVAVAVAVAETLTRPEPQADAETTRVAAPGAHTSPAVAPDSPPRPRSVRDHDPDSLARYMPPASQPSTDQEDSAS